mmetsp:Transcript_45063/g.112126  ORF Transcript_45063/g.112126 Transcript_45063/m.112126 type:complete len:115 (+) Transcript_45063:620-964(+)
MDGWRQAACSAPPRVSEALGPQMAAEREREDERGWMHEPRTRELRGLFAMMALEWAFRKALHASCTYAYKRSAVMRPPVPWLARSWCMPLRRNQGSYLFVQIYLGSFCMRGSPK